MQSLAASVGDLHGIIKPESGESLESFARRLGKPVEIVDERHIDTRTPEEMLRAMKDETTPETVRLFLRSERYGRGGGGRKAVQQEGLRRCEERANAETENSPAVLGNSLRCLFGKERKRARRLLRAASKVVMAGKNA